MVRNERFALLSCVMTFYFRSKLFESRQDDFRPMPQRFEILRVYHYRVEDMGRRYRVKERDKKVNCLRVVGRCKPHCQLL